FGPQVLLLPWTGLVADRFDRRSFLYGTQAALGVLALVLGALTVAGLAQLWHVYLLALLLGCVTAFDAPARPPFVSQLLARPDLRTVLVMLLVVNTLGLNLPIFISTMAVGVFHQGAGELGVLTSIMAIGSVAGALLAARRTNPRITVLVATAAVFGLGLAIA